MNYIHYLSIDCANKSLAIGLYSIVSNFKECITNPNKNELDNYIKINFIKVIDLIPDKKLKDTNIYDKSKSLKINLDKINKEIITAIADQPFELLIEYQMNVNDKSRCIYSQIIYEYIDKCTIHTMPPSKKNILYMNKQLMYGEIMNNSNSNYLCNKNHSKYNFVYYLLVFNKLDLLKSIKKKNYDDIADTFMQCLAHIIL